MTGKYVFIASGNKKFPVFVTTKEIDFPCIFEESLQNTFGQAPFSPTNWSSLFLKSTLNVVRLP